MCLPPVWYVSTMRVIRRIGARGSRTCTYACKNHVTQVIFAKDTDPDSKHECVALKLMSSESAFRQELDQRKKVAQESNTTGMTTLYRLHVRATGTR